MPPLWLERRFRFDLPVEHAGLVLERIRGTPARVEDKLSRADPALLVRRVEGRWSAQEHLGHLVDLEELHLGRLDDFAAGAATLRAWEATNRKTHEARHNDRPLEELFAAFRRERGRFVERLEALPAERWDASALHPRLGTPMRVIDVALFVAEHDDHHLAWMTELLSRPAS